MPATPDQPDSDRHSWERPGAFDVGLGVWRIPLPLPGDALKAVNVYAIPDGEQVVLVDGGWAMADATELLARGLATLGYELRDVRDFYVTHMHRDHYTHAIALRRAHGSTVSLGEGERECLALINGPEIPQPNVARMREAGALEIAREIETWAANADRGDERSDYEQPDQWLANGVELPLTTRTLRVIHTPGHTRGHVVFHDPQHGALFAGDHVLPHITPSIGVELVRPPSPLRDYLTSLELVRAMPDATLLPAHGPVAASVHERIDELVAHHDERLTLTAEAVDRGFDTGWQVARALPWTRHRRSLDELDLFNRILAVNETVAHLRVLVERGVLSETPLDDGVLRYARA